jgi:hypothetical protein
MASPIGDSPGDSPGNPYAGISWGISWGSPGDPLWGFIPLLFLGDPWPSISGFHGPCLGHARFKGQRFGQLGGSLG